MVGVGGVSTFGVSRGDGFKCYGGLKWGRGHSTVTFALPDFNAQKGVVENGGKKILKKHGVGARLSLLLGGKL